MSSYERNKVIRMKARHQELGVDDIWDLEDKYPELFGVGINAGELTIAPTEERFVDYILEHDHNSCSEFGRSRKLTEKEAEKYIEIFKQINPNVKADDLRYVDYCWYNCTEAPDYFDETSDNFYDEK